MSTEYNYPARDYIYDATMLKIQDGDTVYVKLDLGCDQRIEPMKLRLNGINARGKTIKPSGVAAYNFLCELFPEGSTVRVETFKDQKEKYGRYLGVLHHPSLTRTVNDEMIARGFVEPYYGVGKANDGE